MLFNFQWKRRRNFTWNAYRVALKIIWGLYCGSFAHLFRISALRLCFLWLQSFTIFWETSFYWVLNRARTKRKDATRGLTQTLCMHCACTRIGQTRLPKMQSEEMVLPNNSQILSTNQPLHGRNTQLHTQHKIYKQRRQTLPHMSAVHPPPPTAYEASCLL